MADLKLNLIPAGVMPVAYISQYDHGISKTFDIFNGDQAYAIPTGYSVTLRATKPDGYGITTAGSYTAGQNIVTVTIPQQLTAVAGKAICELVFANANNVRVGTINFVMAIEAAALSDSTVISDSDIAYAEEVLDQLQSVQALGNQVSQNTAAISAEASTRAAAVSSLQAADTALSNSLAAETSARQAGDTALSNQIAALQGAVGAPQVAATAAAMTDTSKIYVYTGSESGMTSGNWYYYDGSSWVSGGVYNAVAINTDTTLSVAGMAADAKAAGDEITDLKSQLSIQTRNILPKQPTAGGITVIDLGSEQTFTNGVNISFDLLGFTGNGSAGIITLRDASDSVVGTITLNGMRNLETWKAYSEESNPHTGRYTSYWITALQGSLTFRYVRIVLNSNIVTSGDILNFMLTAGHNPTPYVPFIEAHDYDLRTVTNPIEINTALNSVSLMDSAFWDAKVDWYRNEHGGMVGLAGAMASRLFPCEAGDTLSYTLYMPNGTKVLLTFDQDMQIVRTIDAVNNATPVTGTLTFTPTEHFFAFNIVASQIPRMSLKYNDIPLAIRNYVADYIAEYAVGKERFPDYWDSAVQYAVETIKTNLLALTSGDAFIFVTDQHWVGNAKYSSAIIDYICSQCGLYNVFIGGDIVNNNNASKLGAMTEMLDYLASFQNPHIRLFATLGNHDQNSVAQSDPTAVLSLAEQYNSLIKPEEQWLDTDGTPLCNIYNNDSQKIRYIQFFFTIDSGYRQDVADLLTSAMQSTPTGWTIVLMSHGYWAGTDPSQGAEAYANLIKGLLDGLNADVPLWVVGHCHTDKTAVLTSPGGKTCRIVATTTDSIGQNPSSPSMTAGTATEQAFDAYCLDTTAKTIKITRIGAGVSRDFTY